MRYLLTGGGTGGHINPLIAMANTIKKNDKNAEILFVGTNHGLEKTLVPKAGYNLKFVNMSGFNRNIVTFSNIKTAYYYLTSPAKAKRLLKSFNPDIVFSTGGYASFPCTNAAVKMGIPTVMHESNAIPGKVVKMLQDKVDRIYLNFDETVAYNDKNKLLVTGNPMISINEASSKESARKHLNIDKKYNKIILSFGGSGGSKKLNDEILEFMHEFSSKNADVLHIHATGSDKYNEVMEKAVEYSLDKCDNIRLVSYIYDMPLWESVADVVICRSGAMTISEMARMGKACILVPSPNVADNHQYENAAALVRKNAALLIEDSKLSKETLLENVNKILNNNTRLNELSKNIKSFAKDNTEDIIYNDMINIIKNRKK